jgi:hypothetical protein
MRYTCVRKLVAALLAPATAAVVLCAPAQSQAALADAFDYPAGTTLDGKTAANGNAWAVAGAAAPTITVTAAGLTAPVGLEPASGNAVRWGNNGGANNGAADRLEIGNITSGSAYWSMLFRIEDLAGTVAGTNTTGAFVAGFNNTPGPQATNLSAAAARIVIRMDALDPSKFNLGTSVNSNVGTAAGPQRFAPGAYAVGDTLFLVGRYTFNPGTTTDDVADLWINPDPATFGNDTLMPVPTVSSVPNVGIADFAAVRSFFLRQNNTGAASMLADELRVDTTWAGVTPVPEPGAGLLGLALATSAFGRRRRRGAQQSGGRARRTLKKQRPAAGSCRGSLLSKLRQAALSTDSARS